MTPPLMRPGSVTTPGTFAIGLLLLSSGKPIIAAAAKSAIAEHARRGVLLGLAQSRGPCLAWNRMGSARSAAGDVRRCRARDAQRGRCQGPAGRMGGRNGTPQTQG